MGKTWWTSKTLWTNALMVVAAVFEATGVTDVLTPEVQAEVVAIAMGTINIVLRFVTTKPITG